MTYIYEGITHSTIEESSKKMDDFIEKSADVLIQELREKRKVVNKEEMYV